MVQYFFNDWDLAYQFMDECEELNCDWVCDYDMCCEYCDRFCAMECDQVLPEIVVTVFGCGFRIV